MPASVSCEAAPAVSDLAEGRGGGDLVVVRPDHDRRIDLPGAGPCPRPVDIDRSLTGFSDLVSLRVYSFAQGFSIAGEAEGDEVFIVLMRGKADIVIGSDGDRTDTFSLRRDDGQRVVYMPPHATYRLTAMTGGCDIAYARAVPGAPIFPAVRGFAPTAARLDIVGHAQGMDLALSLVRVGEHIGFDERRAERFVHVRSDTDGVATIAGERLSDWDSVILGDGRNAMLEVSTGTAEILVIRASHCRHTVPNNDIVQS